MVRKTGRYVDLKCLDCRQETHEHRISYLTKKLKCPKCKSDRVVEINKIGSKKDVIRI